MSKYFFPSLFLLTVIGLLGCGGGGGGGGSTNSPSTNACAQIGLPTRALRIINGTACANLSNSPVVRVLLLDGAGEIAGFCSGTMLTQNVALTAGHCFGINPQAVVVSSGDSGNTTAISVRQVRVHPNFQARADGALNDVALLFLSKNLNVPTLPLLRSSVPQTGDIEAIFGYGTDENGNFDGLVLKSGEMEISAVSQDHIDAFYDGTGSNTCTGDSGGPLTVKIGGVSAIAGVTSTGKLEGCGSGDLSRFANLQSPPIARFLDRYVPGAGKL